MPTIQETIRKAREFVELPEGWHFGDGVPPTQKTLNKAQAFLAKAEEFDCDETDVFPGVDGEIQIAIYRGADDYEFTIEINGTITFAHERDGKELTCQEGLSLEEAIEKLSQLSNRAWLSSDLFTSIITIGIDADSVAWLSGTPVMGQAYQLSKVDVLSRPVGQFVSISPGFTELWSENQFFIGQYLTESSLPSVSFSKRTVHLAINAITTSNTGHLQMLSGNLKRCA